MNSELTITEVIGMTNDLPFTQGSYTMRSVGTPNLEDCPEFQIRCGSRYIATVDSSGDENEANAALLSAAPDLYLALEQFLFLEGGMDPSTKPEIIDMAARALDKAKGA